MEPRNFKTLPDCSCVITVESNGDVHHEETCPVGNLNNALNLLAGSGLSATVLKIDGADKTIVFKVPDTAKVDMVLKFRDALTVFLKKYELSAFVVIGKFDVELCDKSAILLLMEENAKLVEEKQNFSTEVLHEVENYKTIFNMHLELVKKELKLHEPVHLEDLQPLSEAVTNMYERMKAIVTKANTIA